MNCIREGEYGLECSGEIVRVKRTVIVYSDGDLQEGNLIVPFKSKLVPMCLTHYTMEKVAKQEMETISKPPAPQTSPFTSIYDPTIPDDQVT